MCSCLRQGPLVRAFASVCSSQHAFASRLLVAVCIRRSCMCGPSFVIQSCKVTVNQGNKRREKEKNGREHTAPLNQVTSGTSSLLDREPQAAAAELGADVRRTTRAT